MCSRIARGLIRSWTRPTRAVLSSTGRHASSPKPVIAEASRVLAWIWLRKRGGDMSRAARRELSDVAGRWFDTMTEAFRVVEDAPPAEPLWTALPRDPNDRAIWSAAVRAGADAVITEKMKDGPPADEQGVRRWADIVYVHPHELIDLLDVLARAVSPDQRRGAVESDRQPSRHGQTVEEGPGPSEILSPAIVELLRALDRRANEAIPPEPPK